MNIKNYAINEYTKKEEVRMGSNYGDVFAYYNLNEDHSLSTLTIDKNSSDYIRDSASARNYANFILSWYMNQHLIINIKIPLSIGLAREVGDVIKFEKLLGDIKPYGINYVDEFGAGTTTLIDFRLNGQILYNQFIITKTNKTLEFVEIECMQIHQGMLPDTVFDPTETIEYYYQTFSENNLIGGCTDQNASNYNFFAQFDNGSCVYENPVGFDLYGIDYPTPINWCLCNFTNTAQGNALQLEQLRVFIPSIKSIQKFIYDESGVNPFNWIPSSVKLLLELQEILEIIS